MINVFGGSILTSAMSKLTSERAKIEAQIEAIKTLTGYSTDRNSGGFRKKEGEGFTARLRGMLTAAPGSTSTELKSMLDQSGYVRPRAGGKLKKYDVPIALGRLAKSGEVVRVGGSKGSGFKYAVPNR